MSPDDEQVTRLRELHDAYVWSVNAAIAQGRDDLAAELADEYANEALQLITEHAESDGPDGVRTPPPAATSQRQRGWLRRLLIDRG